MDTIQQECKKAAYASVFLGSLLNGLLVLWLGSCSVACLLSNHDTQQSGLTTWLVAGDHTLYLGSLLFYEKIAPSALQVISCCQENETWLQFSKPLTHSFPLITIPALHLCQSLHIMSSTELLVWTIEEFISCISVSDKLTGTCCFEVHVSLWCNSQRYDQINYYVKYSTR